MDWLFKEDQFKPEKDNKKYIDKTILSLLGVLSRVREDYQLSILSYLSPAVKMISVFILIFLISLSRSFLFVLLIFSFSILLLSFLNLKIIKRIIYILIFIISFSIIIFLPAVFMGNMQNIIFLIIKIAASIIYLNILTYTTKWRHITSSMRMFFIPDIFILILDLTFRYIYILGSFSVNMLYAIKLRSIGNEGNKHKPLSNILGVLFLKSKEMSEETYYAMVSRGFSGNFKTNFKYRIKGADVVCILANIIVIFLFIYI